MTKRYPLATATWGEAELEAIQRVLSAGRFTMGEEVAGFESEFADFVGSRYAVMVNSGSSANLLAVAALTLVSSTPLRTEDEIVVPAISWSTSYYPFSQYGLRLRFVDVEASTLCLDPLLVESAITKNTRAILVVPLLGNVPAYEQLLDIAQRHNLEVVEDCCEALGARYRGQHVGTFGRVATFSTFFSHHISTMEGGVVVTDDPELYEIVLSLRAHGWTRDLPAGNQLWEEDPDPFSDTYRFILPGYNVRPLELEGAIGRAQLKNLDRFLAIRKANAEVFHQEMQSAAGFCTTEHDPEASHFAFPVITDPRTAARSKVLDRLRGAGVEVRPIVAGNFLRQPVIRLLDHSVAGEVPVADRIHDHGFMVGNNPHDLAAEIADLFRVLKAL